MRDRCKPIIHKALRVVRPQFRLDNANGIHGVPRWSWVWFHEGAFAAAMDLVRVGIRTNPSRLCTRVVEHTSKRQWCLHGTLCYRPHGRADPGQDTYLRPIGRTPVRRRTVLSNLKRMDMNEYRHHVSGFFADRDDANTASSILVKRGFTNDQVQIIEGGSTATAAAAPMT